jgi:hypothetical protein
MQLNSCSGIYKIPSFVEREDLLSSKDLAIVPYPDPNEENPHPKHRYKETFVLQVGLI